MNRTISVSTEVFAAIWAHRKPGEDTENAILQRVLNVKREEPKANLAEDRPGGGFLDNRNGVHFPEGFEIFRTYKRREFRATAEAGNWVRADTGERYASLNQLNSSIAAGTENVWNGNWKFRDDDGYERSIAELRRK